jgi:hypothetical protein
MENFLNYFVGFMIIVNLIFFTILSYFPKIGLIKSDSSYDLEKKIKELKKEQLRLFKKAIEDHNYEDVWEKQSKQEQKFNIYKVNTSFIGEY